MTSKIEWTEVTCPLYSVGHGADARGCGDHCGEEGGGPPRRVSTSEGCRREVVYALPRLAPAHRVRVRSVTIRWALSVLLEVPPPAIERDLRATAWPGAGSELRAGPGWRPTTGAPPRQLLRRGGTDPTPERSPLRRLRARLGAGRASSRVRPPPGVRCRASRERGTGVYDLPRRSGDGASLARHPSSSSTLEETPA